MYKVLIIEHTKGKEDQIDESNSFETFEQAVAFVEEFNAANMPKGKLGNWFTYASMA